MSDSNFQKEFEEALAEWRKRHHVRDDDVLLVCLDLFRIHQAHWDAICRRDFPAIQEFNDIVSKLEKTAFQRKNKRHPCSRHSNGTRRDSISCPDHHGHSVDSGSGLCLWFAHRKISALKMSVIINIFEGIVRWLHANWLFWAVFSLNVGFAVCLYWRLKAKYVVRLKGLTWRRNQFCRGWLITGDTGSGKTSSGINQLAHQVFSTNPPGADCVLMKKGCIGKRSPRWPGTMGVDMI